MWFGCCPQATTGASMRRCRFWRWWRSTASAWTSRSWCSSRSWPPRSTSATSSRRCAYIPANSAMPLFDADALLALLSWGDAGTGARVLCIPGEAAHGAVPCHGRGNQIRLQVPHDVLALPCFWCRCSACCRSLLCVRLSKRQGGGGGGEPSPACLICDRAGNLGMQLLQQGDSEQGRKLFE